MKKIRVMIGTPSWGVAPPQACAYREQLAFRLGRWSADPNCPYEFGISIVPDMLVHYSRETICRTAIEQEFDFVGMIDDDMVGPLDLWERLLAADVDIIAPLAFTRQKPHLPVIYAQRGGWLAESPYHNLEMHTVRNYPKDALVECDAVGFGAVLIKTHVFKRMDPPWFFTNWGTKGTGEDIWLCTQARRPYASPAESMNNEYAPGIFFAARASRGAGARVFCDTRIKMGHLGPEVYIGEADYERCNPEIQHLREVAGSWSKDKSKQNLIA